MDDSVDILGSCAILLFVAAISASFALNAAVRGTARLREQERTHGLPRAFTAGALWALSPLVRALVALGCSANLVTIASLAAGAAAGVSLAAGHFGVAAILFAAASLGDAVDGLVARATKTESAAGALLDASSDRYEEFFAFGGLSIHFRADAWALGVILLALLGSFMVSYGSAKAESLHVAVPGGAMRRAARAICFGSGLTLAPLVAALSRRLRGPDWLGDGTVLAAVAWIAAVANVSAVLRMSQVARAVVKPRLLEPEPARLRAATTRRAVVPVDMGADAR